MVAIFNPLLKQLQLSVCRSKKSEPVTQRPVDDFMCSPLVNSFVAF